MCGRYTVAKSEAKFRKAFNIKKSKAPFLLRYNIAPSQNAPVVTNESPDEIFMYRWGLIPSWAKDPSIGNKLINARSETVHEKPSFRSAFKKHRCLVLADGYYEWQSTPSGKQPYRICRKDDDVLAFAGLWESWMPPLEKEPVHTFTILTTDAEEPLKKIHDRRPVILTPETARIWLDNSVSPEALAALFKSPIAEFLTSYPVSKSVNSPKNDSPDLVTPIQE